MADPTSEFENSLRRALARWDLFPSAHQLQQMRTHFDCLVEANRSMNLTRIVDPEEAATRHYADSLAMLKWVDDQEIEVSSLLDVGTGAGFPAVPLAVMRPNWAITAMDATRKKIDFVRHAATEIGLENLRCVHGHSKHWSAGVANTLGVGGCFTLVTFRALAALPDALEQTAGFVAPGGHLVAYQTEKAVEEMRLAATRAAESAGLVAATPYGYTLDVASEQVGFVLSVYTRRL